MIFELLLYPKIMILKLVKRMRKSPIFVIILIEKLDCMRKLDCN